MFLELLLKMSPGFAFACDIISHVVGIKQSFEMRGAIAL